MLFCQLLCTSLLLSSCGSGSVDGDPSLGAATANSVDSEWVEQVAIEPSISTRLIIRALDLTGAGPWSEPVEFSYLQADGESEQALSSIGGLQQTGLRIEWEPTPGAYGYEILAVDSLTGAVLGEHTLPTEFACSDGVCRVQPEIPSLPPEATPIVATIDSPANEGVAPYTVQLSAFTDDVAEATLEYYWTVSGQFAQNNSDSFFQHTFSDPGVYRVKLEVKDDVGATSVVHAAVTVLPSDDVDSDGNLDSAGAIDLFSYLNEAEEAFGFQVIPTVSTNTSASVVTALAPVLHVNKPSPTQNPVTQVNTPNAETATAPQVNTPNTLQIASNTVTPTTASSATNEQAIDRVPVDPQVTALVPTRPAVDPAANTVNSAQLQAEINSANNAVTTPVANKPEPVVNNATQTQATAVPETPASTAMPEIAAANQTLAKDTTAPIVESVQVSNIATNTAVVTWVLNELSTGQVEFGTTEALGSTSTKETSLRWATHVQRLSNLTPGTQYYYRVTSSDGQDNTVTSQIRTFTTLEEIVVPAPPETIAAPALVPENWPENTNGELPFAGIFYGNHATGQGLQNSGIGVESSRRFRAERTGAITYVRYQNRTLNMSNIQSRCDGGNESWCDCINGGLDEYTCGYTRTSSYHVGNGGTIVVELRTNTSEGLPSDVVLGKTKPFVPMDNASVAHPALEFTSPVNIQEGVIYHLVFTNLTPPTTCTNLSNYTAAEAANCPRNQGAQGLNGARLLSVPSTTGLRGPYLGDTAAANFYRRTPQSDWRFHPEVLSRYELGYTDGVAAGYSYLTSYSMNTGIGKNAIRGAVKARQIFTVMDASRAVDGLWLNFNQTSTADGSRLQAVLKNESGATLATGSIPPSDYCRDTIEEDVVAQAHWCQDWAYTSFGKVVNLIEGSTYSVEFSAGVDAGFVLSANRDLKSSGFKDRNYWMESQAQLSTNNGSSWGPWTTSSSHQRDLSLLFTIQGMPRQLK